ncbi:MAG: hypothetical protein ACREB6_10490, partial [Rhodospirillales bacterium]
MIRFPNVATRERSFEAFLYEWFGYEAVADGRDVIVPSNDPRLRTGPPDILELGPQIDLGKTNAQEAAKLLAAAVPDEFAEHVPSADAALPKNINIAGGAG